MYHFISLSEAIDLTTRFRNEKENILITELQNKNLLPICESFDRIAVETILSKGGCTGIRIYFGMDNDDKVHLIIVGYNAENKDMISSDEYTTTEEEDDILQRGVRCPEICPPPSSLNP